MVVKHKKSFAKRGMYQRHAPHAFEYISQRTTFWVSVLSLFAFVTGNMMGQHGWHVFWASVLGGMDEKLIAYEGMVSPLEHSVDYARWAKVGGNIREHTYRQIPKDYLVPFPAYDSSNPDTRTILIDHLGTYKTGRGPGSHPGMDLAAAIGQPVRAMGNGIVTKVANDPGGYGNYIVIKHPNVPDPDNARAKTNLYSVYAHLESTLVKEADVVRKGVQIGTAGMTGFTTGPHLHVQLERDTLKSHPNWTFSGKEAREAGLTFTQAVDKGLGRESALKTQVHPLLYVQSHLTAPMVVATADASAAKTVKTAKLTREDRIRQRKEKYQNEAVALKTNSSVPTQPVVVSVNTVAIHEPTPTPTPAPVTPEPVIAAPVPSTDINFATILFRHDGTFKQREQDTITITLLDAEGNIVTEPKFDRKIELRTAYGRAEFTPASLSASDFKNGKAEVKMLALGQTTIVIQAQPSGSMSSPMKYEKETL